MQRILRQIYLFAAYSLGLIAALWLAFQLRFDFSVPAGYLEKPGWLFLTLIVSKLVLLFLFGQFGSLLSYFGFYDLAKLFAVCAWAAALALGVWYVAGLPFAPPRAVILTDFLISFLFLCGFRLSLRLVREGYFWTRTNGSKHKLVAIIGAGDVGASLARDFQVRRGLAMRPVAFFDDDNSKWNTTLHGIPVEGSPETLTTFVRRQRVDEVIIALPSASGRRMREIVHLLNQLHLRYESVPSYEQLLAGKIRVSQIRPVEIQDLLGRTPINLSTTAIQELIRGQVVMVTGAGGSIGSELCRQVVSYGPRLLLLVERSEYLLFQIEQELTDFGSGIPFVPLVADVLDEPRLRGIFARFRPSIVFHAAAHKHVPLMEAQPAEACRNNIVGTKRVAELAVAHDVNTFVLISTDKAINPTSVMGATKRVAELFVQALQPSHQGHTRFTAVRFGNVLGSSGSVIPTFKRQIAAGGPVTVTHPEVTRYFMTVNEAVGLVLQSAALANGGEIFVLDMGTPMKIADLARQLVELSGLQPDVDIEIKFTGLRPGEKLFEELNHNSENMAQTSHPKIMRLVVGPRGLSDVEAGISQIMSACGQGDAMAVKLAIKQLVPEYQPHPTT